MRLGLILYGDLTMNSGGFLYDRLLVDHLRRRGHAVQEISLPWPPYALGLADNLSPALLVRLAAAPVDLFLQDELAHPSLFWLNQRLRRRTLRPVVAIVHHLRCQENRPLWQNRLYQRVERRYFQSVDGFIYNSRDTRESVERLLPAPKPCVVATPGGDRLGRTLSKEEILSRAQGPGPLKILFLGNLMPRKGLHLLIEALATLPRDRWELLVVGSAEFDPAYGRAIRRQVGEFGLTQQVRFYGHRDGDPLAALLAGSHFLAVPSSLEGFGIVYLEAMSFGLPIIAAGKGGATELVTPGGNGFLVQPGDLAALTQYLRLLLTDRERLVSMSLAARERFDRHPTWDESLTSACRFLEEMAGKKS
jgi:glycosyltransferase involved in cell wall biosynthesis